MDVYKIGVSIALANGVSSVLAVIQKDILGLKKAIDLTNGGLNRMKVAVAGIAFAGLGGIMLAGAMKFEKAGERYIHQIEMMKTAGFDLAEQQQSIATANRVASSVMTTSPAHNLENIRELVGALNSAGASPKAAVEEANQYLEIVQKADAVMKTTAGGRAMSSSGGVYEMVKALEEIGATRSPERFQRLLGGMVQASEAFGGKINASDWFQTLKYTRGAGQFYSDDFITHYLPTLIQEMKAGGGTGAGGGPGNALASLFQAVVGNTFSIKTRDLGIKLGMIDPSLSTLDRHGRIHNQPGAWFGADVAAQNPALFAQQFLIPKLSAQMGGHMMDRTADGSQFLHVKEMATTLATLFGNRTAQQMVGLLLNIQKMEGDKQLVQRAMELNAAYSELEKHDPKMIRDALAGQWERVSEDLGKAFAAPMMMEAMYNLAKGLRYLAETLEAHPVLTQWIIGFIGALGGFLVILGSLAIGAAALSAIGGLAVGGTIAGILAVGAAIAGLSMGDNWSRAAAGLSSWGAIMARGWDRILEALPRVWDLFITGLSRGLDKIAFLIPAWWATLIGPFPQSLDQLAAQISRGLGNVLDSVRVWSIKFREEIERGVSSPGGTGSESTALRLGRALWDELARQLRESVMVDVEAAKRMFGPLSDAIGAELDRISTKIKGWIDSIPVIAGQVAAELTKIGDAILNWVKSLPGRIPNGGTAIPPGSNPFLIPGSSYRAPPANNNQQVTLINYTVVDGDVVAKSVTKRIVRSGTLPSAGTTGPDVRAGLFGGLAGAMA